MNGKYSMALFLFSLALITCSIVVACNSPIPSVKPALNQNAKIIEWGWGTPTPTYVRDRIQEMERFPFDGLVLDLKSNSGPDDTRGRFSWNVWGDRLLDLDDYSESFTALQNTKFSKFTDNFLRFNVVPGRIDWYDENFKSVIANAQLAAQIAKSDNLRGILLDVEQYQGKLFRYPSQRQRLHHSFADYQQQVRQRGREFMQAINAVYPDINILLTFGYHIAYSRGKPLETAAYGLLPSFLDGMLEAAAPRTLIFDGWEFAYSYKQEKQFRDAYDLMHERGLERTQVQQEFIQHYRASFGLWLDNGRVWQQEDFTKNYFTPQQFENSVRLALKYTDRYVWIYSQKARWWDNRVPQPYIDALRKARDRG